MNRLFNIVIFFLLMSPLCWAGGSKDKDAQPQPQTRQQQIVPAPASPYFTGDGGKGTSIAILAPKSTGLAANQSYLPALVQGEFVSNFSGYSAISVLDRQRLDDQYAELLSGYYDDNAEAGLDLGHLTPTTHIMGGTITRTATGYALQMSVTKTTDKMTTASYSGTCTFAELDNLTGIRRASLELLQKMGVTPTELTRTELSGAAAANSVNAQTALAQGITAQQRGTVVEALSLFIQSSGYDPDLAEAASRLNVLSANVTSGNIGADTRNDIVWRRQWTERLQEAETFFANYIKDPLPYYFIYNTNIRQGEINYQNETVTLSFWAGLLQDDQWVNTINKVMETVETGLLATGRDKAWGLEWPNKSIGLPSPFTDKTNNLAVVAEIINDQGMNIGRQTLTIPAGYRVRSGTIFPRQWEGNVTFPAVNANLITDRLTIRITSIDGIPAENAARQKRISVMPEAEYRQSINPRWTSRPTTFNEEFFTIDKNGKLTRYSGPGGDIVIPVTVTEIGTDRAGRESRVESVFRYKKLTSVTIPNSVRTIDHFVFRDCGLISVTIPDSVRIIGSFAFYGNQLTSVTIPDSVKTIDSYAFCNNQLTSVTIPDSVTTIEDNAFQSNQLTSVTIPDSVTSIGESAFFLNRRLTCITIGADVSIEIARSSISEAFDNNFRSFYDSNGKKAGIYTYRGNKWRYSPH